MQCVRELAPVPPLVRIDRRRLCAGRMRQRSAVCRRRRRAAAVEQRSEHPLAAPLVEDVKRRGIPIARGALTDFHSHVGLGVHGRIDGGHPLVDEVAQAAGTIGYELMCSITPRVQRATTR